jgi:hypothetical protein
MMTKGMIKTIVVSITALVLAGTAWCGEIYKVVDKDGNVTFTDQSPGDGTQPMTLPELSVIETGAADAQATAPAAAAAEEPSGPTPRELRQMYSDFSITQPDNEETFWGTANAVTVSWGSQTAPTADMNVLLYVNSQPQKVAGSGSTSLTLDRGEHQVYAELLNAQNRRIVATETVTFFVMQNSRR